MILFDEDFKKQGAIVHYNTNNSSFIKMSIVLKRMGVKNTKFMLALFNEKLLNINPFSSKLTMEEKLMISMECKTNPWYFFREVCRVPMQGSPKPSMYILNRANLAQMWCLLNSVDHYVTLPRQIGKTVGALSLTEMYLYILGYNINIGMFVKDAGLRSENVRRVKELRNLLPDYMYIPGKEANTDNQETIEYKPFKNKYLTYVANPDPKRSDKHGRGDSLAVTHWEEFAYFDNNQISYEAAIASTDTARKNAISNGIPCANMITTTPGFTSSTVGKYAFKFKNNCMRFTEKLYDTQNNEKLKEVVNINSINGYIYIEYSYKQLGKSEKWFKEVTRNKSLETIQKDYLNMWIHGSGKSVIPKEMMDKLDKHVEEPISITIENGIALNWYVDQKTINSSDVKSIPFVIASDTSDNVGRDFTTLVMLNPLDMPVVMTCRCNQANTMLIVDIVFKLLKKFKRSVFIPERNRAASLLDALLLKIEKETSWNPFERIFNKFVNDKGNNSYHDISLGSVRKQFGFSTTSAGDSRKLLYSDVLMTTLERNYDKIYDKIIVEEVSGLVIRNGRIDHNVSGNDDTLIAYLIGCWFIMYAINIEQYGFKANEIMPKDGLSEQECNRNNVLLDRVKFLEDKLESNQISDIMRRSYKAEYDDLKPLMEGKNEFDKDVISIHQGDDTVTQKADVNNPDSIFKSMVKFV